MGSELRKLKLDELNRPDVDAFKARDKFPVILVMDNIRSALNVGSLFRTADAFALESVFLIGITAQPPHKEIMKTALGSTHSVDWAYFEDADEAIEVLKGTGFTIISLEQTTQSTFLSDMVFDANAKYAFVLGNEVDGVSEAFLKASDRVVEIQQFGTKHSINVAVCGGIIAHQAVQTYL